MIKNRKEFLNLNLNSYKIKNNKVSKSKNMQRFIKKMVRNKNKIKMISNTPTV